MKCEQELASINGKGRVGVYSSRSHMTMVQRMSRHGGMEEQNDLVGWEYGEQRKVTEGETR